MEQEEYSYVLNSEVDEADTQSVITENVINFKRRKIEDLEQELQHENLEGEIIILDTDIALRPETIQIQLKQENEYIDEEQDDFETGETANFADVDGHTYNSFEMETQINAGDDEYLELSALEEGEVRNADTELFRQQLLSSYLEEIGEIGERYHCPICERSFSQKGNLMRHYQTHTGDRPFACSICGHKFTQKSNLQKHLDTHNGDKKFECGICTKAFVQKANLIRHLRIHTGEKPFQCELCGHKFTQKGNLNKHMQLHTTETECVCDFCPCKFSSYTSKMRHETSVHSDKFPDYEEEEELTDNHCDECPATFRTQRALLKHKKYHR